MARTKSEWTRKPGNRFILDKDGYQLEVRENKFSLHGGFNATVTAPDGDVLLDAVRSETKSRAMHAALKAVTEHLNTEEN